MLQALRRLAVAIAIASGLCIAAMALTAPGAYAAALVHLADDDDDRPKGGVDTGSGGTSRDDDDDDDRPRGGVDTGAGGASQDDDDDDDRPKGGVDTGMGGAAGGAEMRLGSAAEGALPVVPLAVAGGGVLLVGAYAASRKLGGR
ncbi:hypothetical protein ACTMTF_38185 [Nonomuraea sp. ZG12]|uniref:hypothetical protein n=1 Tax=Nonomuraea sp. ZG12 TaxID=3452207 RepID=UPI003F8AB2BD